MNPTNDERARLPAIIAAELAKIDGYDPEDQHGGLYDLRWSGGPNPEPEGDAWSMDYLPKGERIAAVLFARSQSAPAAQGEAPLVRMHIAETVDGHSQVRYEPIGNLVQLPFGSYDLYVTPQPSAPGVVSDAPTFPEGLHPRTADLVRRFSVAMAEKLFAAQEKYGYSDGWANVDWLDECRAHLLQHIAKGDPRDVANYAAFLWHHGASTAAAQPSADDAQRAADHAALPKRVRPPIQPLYVCPIDGRLRFQPNLLVQHLLDHGGLDMNALARVDVPRSDREQFAQLIGYSHNGFGTLSYATDRVFDTALERFERRMNPPAAPPADARDVGLTFNVHVATMRESCGETYWVCIDRSDMPKDPVEGFLSKKRITPFKTAIREHADAEAEVWRQLLCTPADRAMGGE